MLNGRAESGSTVLCFKVDFLRLFLELCFRKLLSRSEKSFYLVFVKYFSALLFIIADLLADVRPSEKKLKTESFDDRNFMVLNLFERGEFITGNLRSFSY